MRKFLLLATTAILALGVYALSPRIQRQTQAKNQPRPERQLSTPTTTLNAIASATKALAPQAIGETGDEYSQITDWVSIGQSTYSDIFVMYGDGDVYAYATYTVETEESQSNPGLFRIKNPAALNPEIWYGSADTSKDYYLIIDATDPNAVTIPLQDFGYNNYHGTKTWVKSFGTGTYNQDDGEITFPDYSLVVYRTNTQPTNFNDYTAVGNNPNEGLFSLKLPGAKDFTLNLTESEMCYGDEMACYYLTPGADIASMKYAFVNGYDVTADQALDQARNSGEAIEATGDDYGLMEKTSNGKWTLAVVGYDANGRERAAETVVFFEYDETDTDWTSAGTAEMTENLVSIIWGSDYGPTTYNVEVQENINTPGFFRIVNPYIGENVNYYTSYFSTGHENYHNHYIFIHAENPDQVYLEEAPIGIEFEGHGALVAKPVAGKYGTYANGAITLPAGTVSLWMHNYMNRIAYASLDDFRLVFAKEHTVTISCNEQYGMVQFVNPSSSASSITTSASTVTVAATPVEGVSFLNWTDGDGNVLSTDAMFEYHGSEDITLIANFGLTINYTQQANGGMLRVTTEGNTVNSGSVYPVGTVFDITPLPNSGYVVDQILVNGVALAPNADGNYQLTLTEAANIVATFKEETFPLTLTLLTEGNGRIEAWTEVDDYYNPTGDKIESGSTIEYTKYQEIYFLFIPGDGDQLESATYTIDGQANAMEADGDYWIPEDNDNFIARAINVAPIMLTGSEMTVSATFTGNAAGIEEIGIDPADGPVEYYNLQGIRCNADNLTPGLYIVRQGSKTAKIIVK